MGHVGNVLDMLAQDRTLDPISLSFTTSSSTPLVPAFVDADAPPLIHKVNVALQRVVQKMFLMEHELSRHRRESLATSKGHYYFTRPDDLPPTVAPILTPPVDPLSPPMSASLRWSEGAANWEFMTHEPSFSTPDSNLSPGQPSPSSIQSLSNAVALSADTTATTLGGFLSASLAPSMPSSPDSFCSANSGSPIDDTDVVSTSVLVLDESPCPACIRNCALVASAVVKGDLGVRISCEREACNHSALTTSINQMVSKLSNFTTEVIQVAAQGVEGKLGVQAKMKDEHGIWKEFVSHLNTMTVGHSEQVRDIASVCTAVAHGDLSQKITVSVKGETLVLKNTINTMGKSFC
ncbi:hypothetical protein BGX26_002350 [Mortierella sp. AD094]|nr:hypothetical protein BGX26_002350 [Mortierella sp. AD094]